MLDGSGFAVAAGSGRSKQVYNTKQENNKIRAQEQFQCSDPQGCFINPTPRFAQVEAIGTLRIQMRRKRKANHSRYDLPVLAHSHISFGAFRHDRWHALCLLVCGAALRLLLVRLPGYSYGRPGRGGCVRRLPLLGSGISEDCCWLGRARGCVRRAFHDGGVFDGQGASKENKEHIDSKEADV